MGGDGAAVPASGFWIFLGQAKNSDSDKHRRRNNRGDMSPQ